MRRETSIHRIFRFWGPRALGTAVALWAITAHGAGISNPRNLRELNDSYASPPAGRNAAEVYLKAIRDLDHEAKAGAWTNVPLCVATPLPGLGDRWSADVESAVARLLTRHQSAWPLFVRGSERESCRYPIDLTQGAGCELPHLSGIVNGIRFLVLRGVWNARQHKAGAATESLAQALSLANSLSQEPVMLSQSVRHRGLKMITEGCSMLLSEVSLEPLQLNRLHKQLSRMAEQEATGDAWRRAALGTYLMVQGVASGSVEEKIAFLGRDERFSSATPDSLRKRLVVGATIQDSEVLKTSVQQMLAAWSEPYPRRGRTFSQFVEPSHGGAEGPLRFGELLASDIAQNLSREAQSLTYLRLILVAIALERFALENRGVLPSSVSELMGNEGSSAATDPFSGQNFLYERGLDRRSYIIESVSTLDSSSREARTSAEQIIWLSVKKRKGEATQ